MQQQRELRIEMMGELRLSFSDGRRPADLLTKDLALLCYLKVNGRSFSRREIEALFWPEATTTNAQNSLRGSLSRLRNAQLGPFLAISDHSVAFNQLSRHWADIDALEQQLQLSKQSQVVDTVALSSAVDACRGAFLTAIGLQELPQLQLWLISQRERWRQVLTEALEQLIWAAAQQGDATVERRYAKQLAALDPLHMLAHDDVFTNGATLPAPEPLLPLPTAVSSPSGTLPKLTGALFGRDALLAELEACIAENGVVVLTGPAGCGKTWLALHFAHRLAETGREVVWLDGANEETPAAANAPDLVVLDGVTAATQIEACTNHPLLLTTGDKALAHSLTSATLAVPPLAPAASQDLLTNGRFHTLAAAEQAQVEQLCVLLQRHPLALALLHGCLLDAVSRNVGRLAASVSQELAAAAPAVLDGVHTAARVNLQTLKARHRDLYLQLIEVGDERPFTTVEVAEILPGPTDFLADDLEWLLRRNLLRAAANGRYAHHRQLLPH